MRFLISLFTLILLSCSTLVAQTDEVDVLELRLDDNIATPEVPKKAKPYVTTAMDHIRRHLNKNGLSAKSMRGGEVIEVNIPASTLFNACAVELKADASKTLQPLGVVVREPSKYKLLVAVHTDDTGDDVYADSISAARANAIDDYLWSMAGEIETNVIPYGIGKDEPLEKNTSHKGRAVNRRVEIYIVPDKGLLQMAGVKK